MNPVIPIIIKTAVVAGVVGGVIVMSKLEPLKKRVKNFFPDWGSDGDDEDTRNPHSVDVVPMRGGKTKVNTDLQRQLAESQERARQLENQIKELRTENLKMRAEVEKLTQNLKETVKLEFSFSRLLQWLQKQHGKKVCEGTTADMAELISLLSVNGLAVEKDYEQNPEGFIRVKDMNVAAPEVNLPMITREDDIILKGIVKVPMSFAGAEPPVEQMKPEIHGEHQSFEPECNGPVVLANPVSDKSEKDDDFDDDFIVTEERTKK